MSIWTYFYLPVIVVSVAILNPQRLLMYSNVWRDLCESILLLSASGSQPKLSRGSNVLAFSNSSVIRTGKMFITIYKFLTILILWETHLIVCPGQQSSLFMNLKDSPLVLSRETNDSITIGTCQSPQRPGPQKSYPNKILGAKYMAKLHQIDSVENPPTRVKYQSVRGLRQFQ